MRLAILLVSAALVACSPGPEPIRWGTDSCDQCRMVLSDRAFGAEFVEAGGRVRKFDEVAELARYRAAHPGAGKAYVSNGVDGGLMPAEDAVYVRSPDIRAPMGGHVMSFAERSSAEGYCRDRHLSRVTWPRYPDVLRDGGRDGDG